jgi:hypothetical protein
MFQFNRELKMGYTGPRFTVDYSTAFVGVPAELSNQREKCEAFETSATP